MLFTIAVISLVTLAFLIMPRPPKKWNGENDPDNM